MQGKSLTTSKHHSSVFSPSVPEHLGYLSSVAHVNLFRTKTIYAVLKTAWDILFDLGKGLVFAPEIAATNQRPDNRNLLSRSPRQVFFY